MSTRTEMPRQNDALRPEAAATYLQMSVATLRRRAKADGNFPKPRKIGPRTTIFLRSELDDFLSNLSATPA